MTGFELLLSCLALNIYKEARSEPVIGQMAVALVTLNRAKQRTNGDVCKVVFAKKQFSWTTTDTRNGVLKWYKRPNKKSKSWKLAMQIAKNSLHTPDFTGGATHYHTTSVYPYWAKHLIRVGKWGDHIFYKERSP